MKHVLLLALVAFSCSAGAAETAPKRSLTDYELGQQEENKKREEEIALLKANNKNSFSRYYGQKEKPSSTFDQDSFGSPETSSEGDDRKVWDL